MANGQAVGPPHPVFSGGMLADGRRHLFVSGQLALNADGEAVAPGDMRAQSRFVLGRIRELVEETGAALDDVVKLTAFLTDISQLDEYAAARREVLHDPMPASTAVEVRALAHPACLIEVEAVAVTGRG